MVEEKKRLAENTGDVSKWGRWGPYVADRSWGTVREDYSENGDAWNWVTHEMARYKTYRWGEDGIAGFCDRYQIIALTFSFWNGNDRILKERLFGLNPQEGNHGEDVKECYYHLDALPSHAYLKYLYKYPHQAFPYEKLVLENQKRGVHEQEYELVDTGIFDDDAYFDITIEYAKKTPEDCFARVSVCNRGKKAAPIHVIPQLVFRRRFVSDPKTGVQGILHEAEGGIYASDLDCDKLEMIDFPYKIGERYFYSEQKGETLYTNNESNTKILFGRENLTNYVKDAFHRYIVDGEKEAVNPQKQGTKAAIHTEAVIEPGETKAFTFRFADAPQKTPFSEADSVFTQRKNEADEFYATIHPQDASDEEKRIQRAAFAGMIWSKQSYHFDVRRWLKGDHENNFQSPNREHIRNTHWKHLVSMRILLMPDKWEYPWFSSWDLAFQLLPIALIDFRFAKRQLWHLLFEQFLHPNGQIPACEWEFSEMHPPVQAWAALQIFKIGKEKHGIEDFDFLKRCFQKLVLNFVWWVNKVDTNGNNVFEGGFLGLDNIAVIDRSVPVPGGGALEQSDGTGWMGSFCLCLMRIALILGKTDREYEAMAIKFFQHYAYIASALHNAENREIQNWDEKDGFFYDVISYANGHMERIKVRSLVGIIPLYAVETITKEDLDTFPEFAKAFHWFLTHRSDITSQCISHLNDRWLLSLASVNQITRILQRVTDPEEFCSPFGLRSLSKYHKKRPVHMLGNTIAFEQAESTSSLKGGNANWRGPVWFPTTYMLISSLEALSKIIGDPKYAKMAEEFSKALLSLFLPDEKGKRPYQDSNSSKATDPHFKDHILFYEHFDSETGRGLGASHQTGWTGLIANIIDSLRS